MDHPKSHSLFGLGLPGNRISGIKKKSSNFHSSNIRRSIGLVKASNSEIIYIYIYIIKVILILYIKVKELSSSVIFLYFPPN